MIFHQFSYAGDSLKSVMSIRSLRRLWPDAPIYLWSDSSNPVDQSLDYGDGVIVRQTNFNRLGNLNGARCVLGMRECYATGYAEHPDETCHVKFDPDSFMLRPDMLDRMISENVYFFCPESPERAGYGWFQFHSREFHDDYQKVPCIRQFCRQPSFAEDLVFNEASVRLAAGREVRHFGAESSELVYFFRDQPSASALAASAVIILCPFVSSLPQKVVEEVMAEFWAEFIATPKH